MALRFKTIEELNTETVVEFTEEEKTEAFKIWVKQRLDNHQSGLSIIIHHLEYSLNQGIPMSDEIFNNKFEIEYFLINEDIKTATQKCHIENLPEDILIKAITEFKKMKSKMRKTKAEYKQKFVKLKEAIVLIQEDKDYVNKISNYVQDIITRWCNTYVLQDRCKSNFEGQKLQNTVSHVTSWILSTKLHPCEQEIESLVEKYMANHTVTVMC